MHNILTETRSWCVYDHTPGGYAHSGRDRRANVKAGQITLLLSNVEEIHQMDNVADRLNYLPWETALGSMRTSYRHSAIDEAIRP